MTASLLSGSPAHFLCGFFLFSALSAQAADLIEIRSLETGVQNFVPSAEQREDLEDLMVFDGQVPERVSCTADVRYPVLTGSSPQIAQANRAFLELAMSSRCRSDSVAAILSPEIAELSGTFVSVLFHRVLYPLGGNGSCHGNWLPMLFDLQSGRQLQLGDLLSEADYPAVRSHVLHELEAFSGDDQKIGADVLGKLAIDLQDGLPGLGVYLQNGHVYIEMNSFLLSCAYGNHFPVRLPAHFIRQTPETLNLLGILEKD